MGPIGPYGSTGPGNGPFALPCSMGLLGPVTGPTGPYGLYGRLWALWGLLGLFGRLWPAMAGYGPCRATVGPVGP